MSGEQTIYNEPGETTGPSRSGPGMSHTERSTSETRDWIHERQEELRETMKKIAEDYGERSKTAVSSQLHNYEKALAAASQSLEEDGEQQISSLLSSVAEQLTSSASRLERSTPAELLSATEDRARQAPWVSLAAAAFLGLALSRFVTPRHEGDDYRSEVA